MKLSVKETAVFAMLGAMMYGSMRLMEAFPNIHLLGMFIVAITVVYRWKAFYPILIFVLLTGFFAGFATWWIPYLYIWFVLMGMALLIPKRLPEVAKPVVYMCVSGLHGFAFGILYAPAQALLFGLSWDQMIAWIIAGIGFDITHGISNICCGVLIYPMVKILNRVK